MEAKLSNIKISVLNMEDDYTMKLLITKPFIQTFLIFLCLEPELHLCMVSHYFAVYGNLHGGVPQSLTSQSLIILYHI